MSFHSISETSAQGPKNIILNKGQRAPWSGTLFNKEASAEILIGTEEEFKLKLSHKYELENIKLKYDLIIGNLKSKFENNEIKNKELMDLKNREIERLYANIKPINNSWQGWRAPAGVLVGVTASILIFYISTKITRMD